MRRRVDGALPAAQAGRQLKLGPGGLRDIEFTVQLLQLVHGRADDTLRSPATLPALAALAAGGYVGRDDAASWPTPTASCAGWSTCSSCTSSAARTSAAERDGPALRRPCSVGPVSAPTGRPPTPCSTVAAPSGGPAAAREALLPPAAARGRPATDRGGQPDAGGCPGPARGPRLHRPRRGHAPYRGADRGGARRAAIQRQLLPVMLGWFADGGRPGRGAAGVPAGQRRARTTHWYLAAPGLHGRGRRLCRVLSTSRYVADALRGPPESVTWLADDADLVPLSSSEWQEATAKCPALDPAITCADPSDPAPGNGAHGRCGLLRRRHREGLRSPSGPDRAAVLGALRVAEGVVPRGARCSPRVLVVAMGRWGGGEMGTPPTPT